MGSIPREYEQRCQFDAFCKSVLRNEAWNLKRSMKCQRRHVTPLDTVSPTEWDKLSVTDSYPSDSFVFSSHGYSMCIDNEFVAAAFAGLSATEQSILILRCALDMTDAEIGAYLEMSRSAVQRRRTKALTGLRTELAALMPKGG